MNYLCVHAPRMSKRVQLDSFPYDVTRDGQRFLVNTFVEDSASAAITLIVNWRGRQSR